MTYHQPASNTLTFHDGSENHALVAIFPSSPESGLAVLGRVGNEATLLTTEDVVALRNFCNLALEQAQASSPFQVIQPEGRTVVTVTVPPGSEGTAYRLTLPDGRSAVIDETGDAYGNLAAIIDDCDYA